MKKLMIISVVDGREFTRDITNVAGAPLGAPANDEFYAKLAQGVCVSGYTDVDKVTDERYVHLSPSQIKSVTIQFSKNENR